MRMRYGVSSKSGLYSISVIALMYSVLYLTMLLRCLIVFWWKNNCTANILSAKLRIISMSENFIHIHTNLIHYILLSGLPWLLKVSVFEYVTFFQKSHLSLMVTVNVKILWGNWWSFSDIKKLFWLIFIKWNIWEKQSLALVALHIMHSLFYHENKATHRYVDFS